MKDKAILIEMLFDKIRQYCKTSIELYRLKAIDKITDVFAALASSFIIFISIALFFILLSIGFCFYLGEVFGKFYYGFFAVSAFYALLAILFYAFRNVIKNSCNNYIINQIFKEKNNADN